MTEETIFCDKNHSREEMIFTGTVLGKGKAYECPICRNVQFIRDKQWEDSITDQILAAKYRRKKTEAEIEDTCAVSFREELIRLNREAQKTFLFDLQKRLLQIENGLSTIYQERIIFLIIFFFISIGLIIGFVNSIFQISPGNIQYYGYMIGLLLLPFLYAVIEIVFRNVRSKYEKEHYQVLVMLLTKKIAKEDVDEKMIQENKKNMESIIHNKEIGYKKMILLNALFFAILSSISIYVFISYYPNRYLVVLSAFFLITALAFSHHIYIDILGKIKKEDYSSFYRMFNTYLIDNILLAKENYLLKHLEKEEEVIKTIKALIYYKLL